jgi:hypothetical protein
MEVKLLPRSDGLRMRAELASMYHIRMDAEGNQCASDKVASARAANEVSICSVHTIRMRPGPTVDENSSVSFPFQGS